MADRSPSLGLRLSFVLGLVLGLPLASPSPVADAPAAHRAGSLEQIALDHLSQHGRRADTSLECISRDSFTNLDFSSGQLLRSNLGGVGGRCTEPGACLENHTADTPAEVHAWFRARPILHPRPARGRTPAHPLPDAHPQLVFTDLARVGGQTVDLRVVADTEYRA